MHKSSSLLELDPRLGPDQVLYRTVDFFSACDTVTNQRLMFARSDTFQDRNEGVERLLRQLEATSTGGGCGGMGWNNNETARVQHEQLKRSHYVSCWSTRAESVAMWSLYSQDLQSVRIASTVAKLRCATENLLEQYCVSRLAEGDIGAMVVASVVGRISPVKYSSLVAIAKRLTKRVRAQARIATTYQRKGKKFPTLSEVDPQFFVREEQRGFTELKTTCNLKDDSFEHENEVRLSVRLGETICDARVLDLAQYLDPSQEHHIVLKGDLNAWEFLTKSVVPERVFVATPPEFIESVAIDPRCPKHKADFMRQWFRDRSIRIEESTCFGYLPSQFEVFPER